MKRKEFKKKGKLYDALKRRCSMTFIDFMKELPLSLGNSYVEENFHTRHIHVDNGSNILAVAHLDSVQFPGRQIAVNIAGRTHVFNPVLDDRLGVFTILDILPRLGINVDILLTDHEERCASTASYFKSPKRYNWIVEFDRAGTDVVTYQYEEKEWGKALSKHFKPINWGSYSDIVDLGDLGCCGVNVGVGYAQYHSVDAYFIVEDYLANLERFQKFHEEFKDTRFDHVEKYERYDRWWGGSKTVYPDTSGIDVTQDVDTYKVRSYLCEECCEEFTEWDCVSPANLVCPVCSSIVITEIA